jgi:hypothetical protein
MIAGVGSRLELDKADDKENDTKKVGHNNHVKGGNAGAHVELLCLWRVGVRRGGDGWTQASGAARTRTAAAAGTWG